MILIILTSLFIGLGSYLLRKGDLLGFVSAIFRMQVFSFDKVVLLYSISGIILNLIGIVFWQKSTASQIPYNIANSLYISLTLIFGYLLAAYFEKISLELNFFLGSAFVITGVIILSGKNYY